MKKNYWSWWNRFNRKHRRLSNYEKIKYYLLSRKTDCILLDTPIHGNIGDHAIVQTQKQILSNLGFSFTEIPMPEAMLRERAFAKVITRDTTIIIPGGGFLGDLWKAEEDEVRRILKAFADYPVIIFPQTITFDLSTKEGRQYFEESKEIYSAHKNLKLFVRDRSSFEFMKQNMPLVNCELVPDTVTVYKPNIKASERKNILFCFRNDLEKATDDNMIKQLYEMVRERFGDANIVTTDTVNSKPVFPCEREKMLNEKLTEFASSKLVITDRLHGMILAAITNTPCIAFNNSNGKVLAQYDWIKKNEYLTVVSNSSDLSQIVKTVDVDKQYSYDYEYACNMMQPLLEYIKNKILEKRQ